MKNPNNNPSNIYLFTVIRKFLNMHKQVCFLFKVLYINSMNHPMIKKIENTISKMDNFMINKIEV